MGFAFELLSPEQVEYLIENVPFAIWETLYSTFIATAVSYILGLALGVALTVGEENGIRPLPEGVDWITCSPKTDIFPEAEVRIDRCDELKAVYNGQDMSAYGSINATHRFIQPCDTGDPETNRALLAECIRFCKAHPEWRLSLQTHKYINIR